VTDDPSEFVTATLAPNWWVFVVRGVLALLFGVLAFALPADTVGALVLVFGLFALFDGLLTVGASFPAGGAWVPWSSLTLRGLLGITVGVFALARPDTTLPVLVYLIALWAVAGGIVEIGAALRDPDAVSHPRLLALGGAVAVGFGVFAAATAAAGASVTVLVRVLGAYALVAGVVWLVLGVRLLARADPAPRAA
jgi:uncharacterized membrane protein HdeD (DUF308 family)